MSEVFSMEGAGETLLVTENYVTIKPKGALGFLSKGLKGEKTIYFSSISGIQLKRPGKVFSGYLQFSVPGGNEGKKGLKEAASDENTFMFATDIKKAEAIKDYIEERLVQIHSGTSNTQSSQNVSSEIEKLYDLKSKGIISSSEFEKAKQRLLGT